MLRCIAVLIYQLILAATLRSITAFQAKLNLHFHVTPQCSHIKISVRIFEILASTYGLGPYAPGPLIILKNNLSKTCSKTILEKHTAPGAYIKHAPGAVCISNMVLEYIWLRKFFQIINDSGPWSWTINWGQNLYGKMAATTDSSLDFLVS